MAFDTPYRVEHVVESWGGSGRARDVYLITRSGESTLARCDDPVFAYKIVEVLNENENGRDIHR